MKTIVAANWKMNKTSEEAASFLRELKSSFKSKANRELMIFPPSTCLAVFRQELKNHEVTYGAQNCSSEASGAFTGEISAGMIRAEGATLCLVGHSERRSLYGETDSTVASKAKALQAAGLTPIVCIGETKAEREAQKTLEVVERQLNVVLKACDPTRPLIVAYEPVWAIGTGLVASLEQIGEVHQFLRKKLNDTWGKTGATIPLLYGGSVNAQNARGIEGVGEVNGFLVGGASLKVNSLLEIY